MDLCILMTANSDKFELKLDITNVIFLRYDSDNPRVHGDVGMAGVAVDSVEDMKVYLICFNA